MRLNTRISGWLNRWSILHKCNNWSPLFFVDFRTHSIVIVVIKNKQRTEKWFFSWWKHAMCTWWIDVGSLLYTTASIQTEIKTPWQHIATTKMSSLITSFLSLSYNAALQVDAGTPWTWTLASKGKSYNRYRYIPICFRFINLKAINEFSLLQLQVWVCLLTNSSFLCYLFLLYLTMQRLCTKSLCLYLTVDRCPLIKIMKSYD